jgi:opacity protein-like surface antigen
MARPHVAAALIVLLFTATAAADEHRFEVGGYGGYLFGGTAEGTSTLLTAHASIQSAPSYGAFVDVAVRPNAFAELSYTRQPTELSLNLSDGSHYRYNLLAQYLQVGGLLEYRLPSADRVRPVFGGTLGATVFSADDAAHSYDEWRFSLILEGGVKFQVTDILGLRLRARLLATFLPGESALFCAGGAGCAFAYSGTAVLQGEVGAGAYLSF